MFDELVAAAAGACGAGGVGGYVRLVVIAPDENGEWVVGESDWPPLPPGPR